MSDWNDIINTGLDSASNTSTDDVLWQWFFPGQEQREQFGQQVALQQMQNDWNSEENKMARLIKAGVNPLTAAQGVSQSGQSGSTGLVPSTPQSSSLPDAANAVGNVAENLSSAKERNTLLDEKRKNMIQDTFLKFSQAGYNLELSKNLALATSFMPAEKMLNLMNVAAQTKVLHQEYYRIYQDIEESKKRVEELDAQIDLFNAQRNYTDALKLKAEKDTIVADYQGKMEKWRYERMERLGLDPNNPLDVEIFMNSCDGREDVVNKGLSVVRDISYNNYTGAYEADKETAYDRAYNYARGTYNGDPFQEQYRNLYDNINTLYESKSEYQDLIKQAEQKYKDGYMSIDELNEFTSKVNSMIDSIDDDIKEANKAFARGKYSMGHKSLGQSILEDAAKLGIAVGAYKMITPSAPTIKGFGR